MDYATEAADNAPPIRNLPSSDSESSESELEAEEAALEKAELAVVTCAVRFVLISIAALTSR